MQGPYECVPHYRGTPLALRYGEIRLGRPNFLVGHVFAEWMANTTYIVPLVPRLDCFRALPPRPPFHASRGRILVALPDSSTYWAGQAATLSEGASSALHLATLPTHSQTSIFFIPHAPCPNRLPPISSRSSVTDTHAPIAQSWRAASCVQSPRMGASGDRTPTRNWGLD
ncbi:hypothetical protein FB451DRAFT_402833 [Mycena latifolia]|nr:hypothetical protein FB451DRAFT_402833 [Mycena latifolia]